MNLLKLSQKGIAHYIMPLLIIAAVGAVGTLVLVRSHAQVPPDNISYAYSAIYNDARGKISACRVPNSSNVAFKIANISGDTATLGFYKTAAYDQNSVLYTKAVGANTTSYASYPHTSVYPYVSVSISNKTPGTRANVQGSSYRITSLVSCF